MSYPQNIGEDEKRLLAIISQGHPSRRTTIKRGDRLLEVPALTWDELQLAFGLPASTVRECIAHLVVEDFIDSNLVSVSIWQALKGAEPAKFFWITQKGFSFLQRNAKAEPPPPDSETNLKSTPDDLAKVEAFAKYLAYDLTRYGIGVALLSLESGYSHLETASHLALVTLALDAKEAGTDIGRLMALVPHARSMIDVLTEYQQHHPGLMREALFKNDAVAMLKVVVVDKDQRAWIERVLSDPTIATQRVATSRIDYRKLMR